MCRYHSEMKTALFCGVLLLTSALTDGGDFEAAAYAGRSLPGYSQTFSYAPATLSPIPGVVITQQGTFTLDAKGGLAAGGGATWYFAKGVGIEARLDSVSANIEMTDARFDARATLPPPLPPLTGSLDVTGGTAELQRLKPLSLNLRFRTPGHVRVTVSGGISYLPEFHATATEPIGLGVTGLHGGQLQIATVTLRADTAAVESGNEGRLGANVGAALQVGVAPHVALVAEARGFLFKERRLVWSAAETPASALGRELVDELIKQLPAVEFTPTFFQATAGLSVTF
jgi:hypothetical protein